MASLMIISHSNKIANGIKELASEMNKELTIYAVGGTKDGSLGSDYDTTSELIEKALEIDDVIILFDLGSTLMTIQMVLENLDENNTHKAYLSDAALVEGSIIAAVSIGAKMSIDFILEELKSVSLNKV